MTRDTFKAKGSAAGTDALVAGLRAAAHSCEAYRMPATVKLLHEAAEALAAPAASVAFTERHGKDLRTFAAQFSDPAVTETSITRAQWDAIAAFVREQDAIIDSHEESASMDVEGLRELAANWEQRSKDAKICALDFDESAQCAAELRELIDSTGGAKGATDEQGRPMTYWGGKVPQPAEGDGAVAGYISEGGLKILRNPDWGGARIVRTQHDEYQVPLYTRPAANE